MALASTHLPSSTGKPDMITPTDSIHFSFSTPPEQQPSLEPTRKRVRKSKYGAPPTSNDDIDLPPEFFFSRRDEPKEGLAPQLLTPSVAKSHWSAEEDRVLREAQAMYGNSWMKISKLFPGRSEHAVKNRWNSWRKGKRSGERHQHTCGAKPGRVVQAKKDEVVGIYKEFVAEQRQREDFFESVTFCAADKLKMMKSVTRTTLGALPAQHKQKNMIAQMASDMVARINSQTQSSSSEQQLPSDPLSALESSLLWLDMPKLRQQLAQQPPTPAVKNPLKLSLESTSFKDLTRNDRAAITRAVKDVSTAATSGGSRKRTRAEADDVEGTALYAGRVAEGLADVADFELDRDLAELAAGR